jgi:hypothetical protein
MAMSDNALWYGYLEAGERSTPVLRDRRLITGNPKTIYLYNLKRSAILEYTREIVEPKLRELKADERAVIDGLIGGYTEARNKFQPRGAKIANLPQKGGAGRPRLREEHDERQDFGGKSEEGIEAVDWEEEAD